MDHKVSALLSYPFNTAELRASGFLNGEAYTYALIHTPSGRVYCGATETPRATLNMWAHRLRNPDGRQRGVVGVPVTWQAFAAPPEDWEAKLGGPYATLEAARVARDNAITKLYAHEITRPLVLNGPRSTVHKPSPRPASNHESKLDVPLDMPSYIRQALAVGEWTQFLQWVQAINRKPNPSDAQVREVWHEYHVRRGLPTPAVVHDPLRSTRHKKAERVREYARRARDVRRGDRPRTWYHRDP